MLNTYVSIDSINFQSSQSDSQQDSPPTPLGDFGSNLLAASAAIRSTSLDRLDSTRSIGVLSSSNESRIVRTARRVDEVARLTLVARAEAQVEQAYHTPTGLVSWLRSHLFLGPQKSRRGDAEQTKEARRQIANHPRIKADPGTTAVVTVSALSKIAGVLGLAASSTHLGLEIFHLLSAARLVAQPICPSIAVAQSTFLILTSAMRIVRQTRLKHAAKEALQQLETNPAQAEKLFHAIVGAPGSDRAEKMRALRWSLGKAETEAIMVVAARFDRAVKERAGERRLSHIAAIGMACIKRSAIQHRRSAILSLLLNLALVAVAIAMLVNPGLAPLAVVALALSIAHTMVSTHRGVQDLSLVLQKLGLDKATPIHKGVEAEALLDVRHLFDLPSAEEDRARVA